MPGGFLEEEILQAEKRICPDNDDLPSAVLNYRCPPGWMEILERDSYQCSYPGCGARSGLHPHHIEFRSRFGKKTRAERDAPSNQVTACALHHRMLHAGVISVKGRAPDQLEWSQPAVMVAAMRRLKEDFLLSLEDKDRAMRGTSEPEPAIQLVESIKRATRSGGALCGGPNAWPSAAKYWP